MTAEVSGWIGMSEESRAGVISSWVRSSFVMTVSRLAKRFITASLTTE